MSGTLIHHIKQHKHFLKLFFDCFLTRNVFDTTCFIAMANFTVTSKAVILVTIYVVFCLQNKIFIDTVQKRLISETCCGKFADSLCVLLYFFFFST